MLDVKEYFEGNVKSIGFENHGRVSVGVMNVGEYTFGTGSAENMTVIKGELIVRLPESEEWVSYKSNESFHVVENASFDLKVNEPTAYLCEYL